MPISDFYADLVSSTIAFIINLRWPLYYINESHFNVRHKSLFIVGSYTRKYIDLKRKIFFLDKYLHFITDQSL